MIKPNLFLRKGVSFSFHPLQLFQSPSPPSNSCTFTVNHFPRETPQINYHRDHHRPYRRGCKSSQGLCLHAPPLSLNTSAKELKKQSRLVLIYLQYFHLPPLRCQSLIAAKVSLDPRMVDKAGAFLCGIVEAGRRSVSYVCRIQDFWVGVRVFLAPWCLKEGL